MSADDVKLVSSDGKEFSVPSKVAKLSTTLRSILEDLDTGSSEAIPIPNVTGAILEKVLEYATHHQNDPVLSKEELEEKRTEDITGWDLEFCKVDQGTLFEMILAANFLDINPMLNLLCKSVANMIKGKKAEEIRRTFNIKNDFTPEEEEQVRKENEWCETTP